MIFLYKQSLKTLKWKYPYNILPFILMYFPVILRIDLFSDCDNIWDCCTSQNPCGLNSGDCDLNDHCMNDLVCGIANCGEGFPANADCCVTSGTYISCLTLSGLKSQDCSSLFIVETPYSVMFRFQHLFMLGLFSNLNNIHIISKKYIVINNVLPQTQQLRSHCFVFLKARK